MSEDVFLAFIVGFVVCAGDLFLLHALALLMVRGSENALLKGILGILGVGKFAMVGMAIYFALVVAKLPGLDLFFGALSALLGYVSFLVVRERAAIKDS